jgi:hypothetical protein
MLPVQSPAEVANLVDVLAVEGVMSLRVLLA